MVRPVLDWSLITLVWNRTESILALPASIDPSPSPFPQGWKLFLAAGLSGTIPSMGPAGLWHRADLRRHFILQPLLCRWTHTGAVGARLDPVLPAPCPSHISTWAEYHMMVLELPGRGAVTSLKCVTASGYVSRGEGWRVKRPHPSVEKHSMRQAVCTQP